MACFHPLEAWRRNGAIVFAVPGEKYGEFQVPCGQCIGCRLERSRQWAVRCVHESQMHEVSSFVTLTYDDDRLPENGQLVYRDFQLFMKRLRKTHPKVRFFMCGEYGDNFWRPHFHSIIFGYGFPDRKTHKESSSGFTIYRSDELSRLWQYGFSSTADFSFDTAAYVARYVCKKVTGARAADHYSRVNTLTGEVFSLVPEFTHMSLKPGIGATWFAKWKSDVYPRDFVVMRGVKMKPPKFYDRLLALTDMESKGGDFVKDIVEFGRAEKAAAIGEDSTPDRLAVREQVTAARLKFKVRTLE